MNSVSNEIMKRDANVAPDQVKQIVEKEWVLLEHQQKRIYYKLADQELQICAADSTAAAAIHTL